MNAKEFKKTINNCLVSNGFSKQGGFYYKSGPDVISVLGLQKSNYDSCYYINAGLVVKEINPRLPFPQEADGDIRFRLNFELDGHETDCIKFEQISDSHNLSNILEKKITEFVNPSLDLKGLKDLLIKHPVLLYQTKLDAKKYLGIET
ncbi:MAG TPA: DUF4304 domain-containing protein [Bacillales bacterium]|nr:DUF4304 domain-containing protein [Bacillales bacterium]